MASSVGGGDWKNVASVSVLSHSVELLKVTTTELSNPQIVPLGTTDP